VLFWCQLQQTGIVTRALRAEAEGWADVIRAPFESEGADVREL
jgi:homoserine kinase